jgi:hypothetical protein
MVGWLKNNELEKIWKEPAVVKFVALSLHLHDVPRYNMKDLRITVGFPAEMRKRYIPNTSQRRYRFG